MTAIVLQSGENIITDIVFQFAMSDFDCHPHPNIYSITDMGPIRALFILKKILPPSSCLFCVCTLSTLTPIATRYHNTITCTLCVGCCDDLFWASAAH